MPTNTERTLKLLRDAGYDADTDSIVERWIKNGKFYRDQKGRLREGGIRKDFKGFADILAFNDDEALLVQSCGSSYSAHLNTILAIPAAIRWAKGPNRRILLIGWRTIKIKLKSGKKVDRWRPRIGEFHLIDGVLDCQERSEL